MYNRYFSYFGRPPVSDDICKDSTIRHPWLWRRRFLKVLTIYGYGGHLGQWTATILAIFHFPALNLRNIIPEAPEEKSFEILNIFPIQMHREANLTSP